MLSHKPKTICTNIKIGRSSKLAHSYYFNRNCTRYTGLLLFLVCINDFCNLMKNTSDKIVCYVDTSILLIGKEINNLNIIPKDIMFNIENCLINNKLDLNMSKTKYVHGFLNKINALS